MAKAAAGEGRGIPWRMLGWGAAGLVLLLPLAAMQLTDEVAWTAFDFAVMAALLGSVGLGLELAVRTSGDGAYRAAAGLALAAAFLLVWINGAVGIIGSEKTPANLLYGLVLVVGLAGAILARFRPAGMARALAAAALAQASVPLIAAALMPDAQAVVWAPEVVGLTGAFALLWLLSAGLFHRAARRQMDRTAL